MAFVAFVMLMVCACDRPASAVRDIEVHGLPSCPAHSTYARPIIVRLDRDATPFEETFRAETRVDSPPTPPNSAVRMSVTRRRMRVTLRAGLCAATSMGTWDCKAATWLTTTTADLDARSEVATVTFPHFEAPCVVALR